MRGPLIIAVVVLVALFTVMIVGQRSAPPQSAPGAGAIALTRTLGVPVIIVNAGLTWDPTVPVGTFTDVSVVNVGDRARIYNTRSEWVPCTLSFYDTQRSGIGCARIDLPPVGAVAANPPATDRPLGFMEITVPMDACELNPEGGDHIIGYGSEPLTIPLLKTWGFLKDDAPCPESAILQDATDISGENFVLIVVGRTVSYSFPVTPAPGASVPQQEIDRFRVATEMIEKVREEDAAIGSGKIPTGAAIPPGGTVPQ